MADNERPAPAAVDSAGRARYADGTELDDDERRDLVRRLQIKRDRGKASTVELRCLAALERRR